MRNRIVMTRNFSISLFFAALFISLQGIAGRAVNLPAMVDVESTVKIYNPRRPWALERTDKRSRLGVYVTPDMLLVGDVDNDRESTFLIKERRLKAGYRPQLVYFDSELRIALVRMIRQPDGEEEPIEPVPLSKATELPQSGQHLIVAGLNQSGSFHEYPAFYDGIGEGMTTGNRLGIPVILFNSTGIGPEAGDPLLHNGQLIGFVSHYDHRTNRGRAYPVSYFLSVIDQAKQKPDEQLPEGSVGTIVMDPGFRLIEVKSDILRKQYLIPEKRFGMMVTTLFRTGGSAEVLREGDIIIGVDGKQVLPGGLVEDSLYGKIPVMSALRVHDGMTRGFNSTVNLELVSDRKVVTRSITMKPFQQAEYRIPPPGIIPEYAIIQGGIFLELSHSYLDAGGDQNSRFEYLVNDKMFRENIPPERYVILDTVLPLSVSGGYGELKELLVISVNGIAVRNLKHLVSEVERLKSKADPIIIRLEGNREFVIDPGALGTGETELVKRYGIMPAQRLTGNQENGN